MSASLTRIRFWLPVSFARSSGFLPLPVGSPSSVEFSALRYSARFSSCGRSLATAHHAEHRRDHGQAAQPGSTSASRSFLSLGAGLCGPPPFEDACDASGDGTCEGVVVVGGSVISGAREKREVPQRGP